MKTAKPEPQDRPEPHAPEAATPQADQPSPTPFDWQVLLLRYLPHPGGADHIVKRLAPR